LVPVRGALTRTQQLSELAYPIKKGGIYSVRVADDEAGIEVFFWLCRVLKKPEQATSDILHCGDHFKAGAWLVDIKWLSFQKTNSSGGRVYKAQGALTEGRDLRRLHHRHWRCLRVH